MAIYAVLVGINGYPEKPLAGCLNDVKAIQDYLHQFAEQTHDKLHLHVLTDDTTDKPTRENLIRSFDFFADAKAQDFCLFYYSGHGSFATAPQEFWTETDGYNESFVCIDSRRPGGRDLVDKEMGYLIWKTFRKKAGVTFIAITDCCHSGTITRAPGDHSGITDRMESPDTRLFSVSDYYGFGETIDGEQGYVVSADKSRVTVRRANHLHMAASRDNQTSKELLIEGVKRGAFTHALLKTLYASSGLISYRELVEKAAVLVKNLVLDQQPDINLNGDLPAGTGDQFFLSHSGTAVNPLYPVYSEPQYGWCIKAGQLQGVSKGDKVIIKDVCETIVTGNIAADLSTIAMKVELGKSTNTYRAAVGRESVRPLSFSFAADTGHAVATLLQGAAAAKPSAYVAIAKEGSGQYIVHAQGGEVFISLPGSTRPVFKPLPVSTEEEAWFFLERIELVSKWNYLRELQNPETKLGPQHYKLELYRNKQACNYDVENFEVVSREPVNDFYYKQAGNDWCQPAFRLSFTNNSGRDLWVACSYMGFDYSISNEGFDAMQVGKEKTAWIMFNDHSSLTDVIRLQIEGKFQDLGYTEITEHLKLFVSTDKIDKLGNLNQDGIDMPVFRARGAERGLGAATAKPALPKTDWTTETIGLHIVRPADSVPIVPGQKTELQEITILNHPSFDAKVSLTSSGYTARSADFVQPPHLAKKNTFLQPYDLSSATRSAKVMDVLELMDVRNAAAITPQAPLVVARHAARSVQEERVIPIGYDAETGLYYPLGYTDKNGHVVINTLPEQTKTDAAITQRSLLGSIKIYFQKVIGQRLGFAYHYPRLAIARVIEGRVAYESDMQKVKQQVAKASTILLFVHGIIGDTEGMVKCVKTELTRAKTLEQCFDLVLGFDYENLNTEIEVTAGLLKQKLQEAGFGEQDGKKLTIVAHSMGGLVSRWMIEKLQGDKLVDRLVMLGTPNNGSPWADVRDLADTLLTFAINGAAFLKPWMFVLSGIGKLVTGLQVTLKQMDAQTGIYTKLNDGTTVDIPYTLIAGNTRRIIPDYNKTTNLLGKLFEKLKKRGVYDALDKLLFKKPNDIAVADESIITIRGSDSWKKGKPVVYEVASDHLNYFMSIEALEEICRPVIK
ncbi:MAG: caspase family protein [Williamsia sp.]|nr:caspase family protein [Williamsia sp.]